MGPEESTARLLLLKRKPNIDICKPNRHISTRSFNKEWSRAGSSAGE